MYVPRGFGLSELGDVEVFVAQNQIHLFHLTLPNHDVVQHAVSDDGLAWRSLPPALYTGNPGDCDDDQIWTMSVTEREGAFFMLYTALSRAEDGMVQRTALARSTDLIQWDKVGCVAAADPRWYEADVSASGRVSWRDPKPIQVGDAYYAVLCARERSGPLIRRGCIGLLTSPDLETWEVEPPLFAPRRYWDLECPQIFTVAAGSERDGSRAWYLTAAIMDDRRQRYWLAPGVDGPYVVPSDGGLLAPDGHYAGRSCRWHGLDLLYCWHRPSPSSGWLATTSTVDWLSLRNPFGKFVVPPLVLRQRDDGCLSRHTFPGWSAYHRRDLSPPQPMASSLYRNEPASLAEPWRLVTAGGGMDLLATTEPLGDLLIEGDLILDAAAGGVAFRLDDEGGGYFVELRVGGSDVVLREWRAEQDPRDDHRVSRLDQLQCGRLRRIVSRGDRLNVRLLVVGPYVECSVDGEVVIATLSAERVHGRAGIWAESGSIVANDLLWTPMRRPRHG